MPGLISVSEFVEEIREDISSPSSSTFVSKMSQCRQTITALEETLDADREGLSKLKKAIKAIHAGGMAHVYDEMYLSRALERLGTTSLAKDQEPEIGASFMKFSVVNKELAELLKTLMQNLNNMVLFPVDSLLKGELRGTRGDLKRPFDKACKDYEVKYAKLEKEKKALAKEAGLVRTELSPVEVAEELDAEKKMFQLQMCEYLIKVNEIKTKKSVELLQHLIEFHQAQQNYFQDAFKTLEQVGSYVNNLSQNLYKIRQKQEEERKQLVEIRTSLRNSTVIDKEQASVSPGVQPPSSVYSLHQLQGDKQHGLMRCGFLYKKSESKMRKVWQKRKCEVRDGFLSIYHADESKPPTRVNLLTCQIKPVLDEKRCFDLISYNRTYHFQAEDDAEFTAWMSVLVNSKEGALMKAFDDNGKVGSKLNQGFFELQQAIIKYVLRLPGNDCCADCCSQNDATWLSTNFGIIVCIECSGVHREMGVHVSRIQSLTLDHVTTSQLLIARHMSNHSFNEIMEATLHVPKPTASSSMEERSEFIRAKYIERRFAIRTCSSLRELHNDVESAINNSDIHQLLQAFVECADFTQPLLDNELGETPLHLAIRLERGHSLHIVEFIVQNSSTLTVPNAEGNTALHYCCIYNQPECMKLLLRSGANAAAENKERKTALDIARQLKAQLCQELLEQATSQRKSLFDCVNIDWNLSQDEGGSVDFSDEDTLLDNNNMPSVVTERQGLPSIPGGRESPVNVRSRSSTSDSFKSGSSPSSGIKFLQVPAAKSTGPKLAPATVQGPLKKRAAPLPPPERVVPSLSGNSKAGSADQTRIKLVGELEDMLKNRATLQSAANMPIPRATLSKAEAAPLRSLHSGSSPTTSASILPDRPRQPPPPVPVTVNPKGASRKTETKSADSSAASPPKAVEAAGGGRLIGRRCRAIYDCEADNDDEISFQRGEIIVITQDKTEEDDWMAGYIESDPSRDGVFPISFVYLLSD